MKVSARTIKDLQADIRRALVSLQTLKDLPDSLLPLKTLSPPGTCPHGFASLHRGLLSSGGQGKMVCDAHRTAIRLPGGHGVFEHGGEGILVGRARREFRHTVLRQRALDQSSDITRLITDRLQTVRDVQPLHK